MRRAGLTAAVLGFCLSCAACGGGGGAGASGFARYEDAQTDARLCVWVNGQILGTTPSVRPCPSAPPPSAPPLPPPAA